MNKYIVISCAFLYGSLLQATPPFVTTFVNTTAINIHFKLHYSDNKGSNSDNRNLTEDVAMAQSYQVVNFDTSKLVSIELSSPDRDNYGNFYESSQQELPIKKEAQTYIIKLQKVDSNDEDFQMRARQKIICELAEPQAAPLKNVNKA